MLKAVHEATHPARLTMQKEAVEAELKPTTNAHVSERFEQVAARPGEDDALGDLDDLDAHDDLDEGFDDDDSDDLERA